MSNSLVIKIKPLLAVLASVYTIQSLIGMFVLQGFPAVMRSEGISTSQIGLFYLAMSPWVLKFLWAPYIEHQRKRGKHFYRHAWIIISAQLSIVLILLLLAATDSISHFESVFASVLALTLMSTFADITADGLAVDQLSVNKRYLGNVMQVGGSYLGAVFGGGLFIYFTSIISWKYALYILAALVIVMSLPTLSLFNIKGQQSARIDNFRPSLRIALKNPLIRTGLLLVVLTQLGTRGALSMMMPFLFDQGVSLVNLGLLVAGGGVVTGLTGAVLGGWLVKKVGAVKGILFLLVAEGLIFSGLMLYSLQLTSLEWGLQTLFIVNSLIAAAKFVALYTLMMEFAHGKQSGVDFSLFQSMDMLVAIVMAIVCGALIAQFGYVVHYGLLIVSTCVSIFFLDKLTISHRELISAA